MNWPARVKEEAGKKQNILPSFPITQTITQAPIRMCDPDLGYDKYFYLE